MITDNTYIRKTCIICSDKINRQGRRGKSRRSRLCKTCSPRCSRLYLDIAKKKIYDYKKYRRQSQLNKSLVQLAQPN